MSLQPYYISGFNNGLINNKKPFLLPDQAFQLMENAYCWRDRIVKREGLQLMGRLQRDFTAQAQADADGTSDYDIADLLASFRANEPNAELRPGSVVITLDSGGGNETVFTDQSDGTLLRTSGTAYDIDPGTFINYITGAIHIEWDAGGTPPNLTSVDADFSYYPGLPVMGIIQRERADINNEQTIYFDTIYAYTWSGTAFSEYITGTTWSGSDSDFFWGDNYRGSDAFSRLLFVTNFFVDQNNMTYDPIRYTNSSTWTDFAPLVSATDKLYQARIIIPYYGRLLALNTWEGATGSTSDNWDNYFNRCRFSQLGDPTDLTNAWRSDVFGRGGFIDAPTNEEIISAIFFKNTLIVFFESTTWQLRYVGEYGLPFIWERISSDFGSESTFSTILFDEGVLGVGDKAIISSNSINVQRIDLDIPEQVYQIQNKNQGHKRVQGIRDFQKEIVYWCYTQANEAENITDSAVYPNHTLVYNYRNNTWATFRNNITAFGRQPLQTDDVVTWDSNIVKWDNEVITWNDPRGNVQFERIVAGNQQGFVHFFGYTQLDEPSLSITGMVITSSSVTLTVINHNLYEDIDDYQFDYEIVYLQGALFVDNDNLPLETNLNDQIYKINWVSVDSITLEKYNFDSNTYESTFNQTPTSNYTYIGGGTLTLLPRMKIWTKDFNPFQPEGFQNFTSYVDLLTDASPFSQISIEIYANTKKDKEENIEVGNKNVEQGDEQYGFISAVTQANPGQVTSANHGLLNGYKINFSSVGGMTELNNLNEVTVTVVDENNFTFGVDTSVGYSTYTSGGIWSTTKPPYYEIGSEYFWHRFYATATGQYLNFQLTYNEDLMNRIQTHNSRFVLNALVPYFRKAGQNIF